MDWRIENSSAIYFLPILFFFFFLFYRKRRNYWEWTFKSLAFLLAFVGFLRIQSGSYLASPDQKKTLVLAVMDTSLSMLAEDTRPNRFIMAQTILQKLIKESPESSFGLATFTNDAYLILPPTFDSNALSETLDSLNPRDYQSQGTDLTQTFQTIQKWVRQWDKQKESAKDLQIVLFSDGETHSNLNSQAFSFFSQRHIPIHTVALGSTAGARIPLRIEWDSREVPGQSVLTQSQPQNLEKISQLTDGDFYVASMGIVPTLKSKIQQKSGDPERVRSHFKVKEEWGPNFIISSLVFFVLALLVSRWEYVLRILILGLFIANSAEGASSDSEAVEKFNTGTQYYQQHFFPKAVELFQESILMHSDNAFKRKAYFNLGNTYYSLNQMEEALQAYQNAYDLFPNEPANSEIKTKISDNISMTQKKLEEMKQQKEGKGKPKKGGNQESKKDFEKQPLSDYEKQKIYEMISQQEQETRERLQREAKGSSRSKKPW